MIALRAKSSLGRLQRHSWGANWGYEYWFPRPEEHSDNATTREPPLVLLGGGRDTAGPMQEQYTMDDSVLNEAVSKTLKRFLPDLWNGTDLFEPGREPEMEWVSYEPVSRFTYADQSYTFKRRVSWDLHLMGSQSLVRYLGWMDNISLQDLRDMGCLERLLRTSEIVVFDPLIACLSWLQGGGSCWNDCSKIDER